jgi:hypothetical protein
LRALLQGTFAFRTVPATLRVDDTSVHVGAMKVDVATYRAAALQARKATGQILPGCVHQGERANTSPCGSPRR